MAPSLTARERDVLALLRQGSTNRSIARQLGVAEVTVNKHVHSLMQKTGSKSRLQVVVHCMSRPERV